MIAYALVAFIRAPIKLIANHHQQLEEHEARINRIITPAEFLQSQLDECKAESETVASQLAELKLRESSNQAFLTKWSERISVAENQLRAVGRWVLVESCSVEASADRNLDTEAEPFIEFTIAVFNGCIFPIILEEQTEGHVTYLTDNEAKPFRPLEYEPKATGSYVAPGCSGIFKLRQRLHRDDARYLAEDLEARKLLCRFFFGNLKIFISDNVNGNTLGRQTLVFSDERRHEVRLAELWETRAGLLKRFDMMIAGRDQLDVRANIPPAG
jgi:hypothetical protein